MFKYKFWKKSKTVKYREIKFSELGTPEENSRKLLQAVAEGNEWMKHRKEDNVLLIGYFLSCVLLIEHKLVLLLRDFCPDIESKMLGQKIDIYKEFLKEFDRTCPYDVDISEFRNLIAPLKQVKKLRDKLAHNIETYSLTASGFEQVFSYANKECPDMSRIYNDAPDENHKIIGVALVFGFIFSTKIASIRLYLNQYVTSGSR